MFLRNFWHTAAACQDVKRELLARTVLGVPMVLYRKLDGSVAAIEDRCIHRRVSLSTGRLIEDRVRCGYHGLEYDETGKCVRIPGQERIPPQACVRSYPVAERDGFVWVWTGDPARADPGGIPDYFMCSSPRYAGRTGSMHIQANYQLMIDNILDLSHIAYVHRSYENDVLAGTRPTVESDGNTVTVTRVMSNIENPPLYRRVIGTGRVDRKQELRFFPGANLQLHVTIRPAGADDDAQLLNVYYFANLTPETETSLVFHYGIYRDFDIGNEELTALLINETRVTVSEDKAIVEDQQHNLDRDGPHARMLDIAVDRGPLEARRLLRRLHAEEKRAAAAAAE